MDIRMSEEEVGLLREVAEEYLSDLRTEILDTDNFEFRESLKRKEESIRRILEKLGQPVPLPLM